MAPASLDLSLDEVGNKSVATSFEVIKSTKGDGKASGKGNSGALDRRMTAAVARLARARRPRLAKQEEV